MNAVLCEVGGGAGTVMASLAAAALLLSFSITGLHAQSLQFTQPMYLASANETFNSPTNPVPRPPDGFLIVTCTGGSNVHYDIISPEPLPFGINETAGDGEFYVTEDLDYDTHSSPYAFSVVCYEDAARDVNDTAEVEITLLPVNEYRPEVLDDSMTVFILVNENLPVGTVIVANSNNPPPGAMTTYDIRDGDAGIDGIITYTSSDITDGYFELDLARGFLTVVRELDRDSDTDPAPNVLRPDITACDFLPPIPTCPNIDVNILVNYVNEFPPEFSQERYIVAIPRSVAVGYTVVQATCTDQDKVVGAFEGVEFAEGAGTSVTEIFTLDNEGNIEVPAMTFGTAISFQFSLRCYDDQGMEDFADVTINIDDPSLNEYTPEFSNQTYSVSLPEDTAPGSTIIQGSCVDHDQGSGEFASIEYGQSTQVPSEDFELNTTTGAIIVGSLDHETTQLYQFTLQCSDTGGLSTTADVTIVVTDINDNPPRCDNSTVTSSLQVGTYSSPIILFTVSCSDLDSGMNAQLTYGSIQTTPPIDGINIFTTTGEVSFRGVLDNTGSMLHTVTFTVSDSGDPVLSQDINMEFRMDITPSCSDDDLDANLPAGRYNAIEVLSLSCQGHDDLSYGLISSTIPPDSGTINIDSSIGKISFTGEIDESTYEATIRVMDPNGLYSDFTVTIEVGPAQTQEDSSDDIPIYVIVIPIVIIVILFIILNIVIVVVIVMVIRRRRKKAFQARVVLTAAILEKNEFDGVFENQDSYSERAIDIGDLETTPYEPVEVATGNGAVETGGNGEESSIVRPASQMDLDIEVDMKTNDEHLEPGKTDPPQATSEQDGTAEFDTTAM